jgi:hypothetical protein
LRNLKYSKPERIGPKGHSVLNERWVQERGAEDPALLGCGDLILKTENEFTRQGGRLVILAQEVESSRRYEIGIQLGKYDEPHIIRMIEYLGIERQRYPQYEYARCWWLSKSPAVF